MPLILVGIGIIILLILMLGFKFDAFLSLLITSLIVGLMSSMGAIEALQSILKGVGDTMGSIVLILVFGAMLGKLIENSGAAHVITNRLIAISGMKNIQYAILVTGFLVGLPMMYNASFLVLIPLIYTLSSKTKLPLIYLGIPLSASLSVAHGYLPPHPAPTYVSFVYGADINQVLLLGLVPVIPACLLAGIYLSRFFKKVHAVPPKELYDAKEFKDEVLPSFSRSLIVAILPVILMLTNAVVEIFYPETKQIDNAFLTSIIKASEFLGDPTVALACSVLAGLYLLGIKQGNTMSELMKQMSKAVGSIAMIIMIIAAGGAFKQVLIDGGVTEYIKELTSEMTFNPIIMGWVVAAVLRLAIGSATVATMTAAGILLPLLSTFNVQPEIMVLATGSGSLMFSHFNDVGFWMFKEYYNVSIKHTFAIWTVMESIVAVVGLLAALFLHWVL